MELFWFIPTHGDGRYLGTSEGARAVSYAYCKQIAQAADELGFGGVLLPTGKSCEDSWVVASTLVPATRKLKFLVAARPGLIAPTMAARMAATLDRFSEGRLLINVVAGGDPDVYLTWGRTSGAGGGENRANAPARRGKRTDAQVRHPAARHRARNGGGSLARGG